MKILVVCCLCALASAAGLRAQAAPGVAIPAPAPANGAAVLQAMHDAYAGRWYSTLRFVQKTTQYRPNGAVVIATWYESLRQETSGATRLRIDIGDPRDGNGVLYTADSTWGFRAGKLAGAQAGGNEFLPLIEGVYLQPVERTMSQLAGTHVDFSRTSSATFDGRSAWVIGVSSPQDSVAPQIWVDADRKVVVRMVLRPAPGAPVMDIHLGDYVAVGGGWLATKVVLNVGGQPRQVEDYADWHVGMDLPDELFSVNRWIPASHWAWR